MKNVESVRKDKAGCKIGDDWYMFSPAVKKFVENKELFGKKVDIELSEDKKLITKITFKEGVKPIENNTKPYFNDEKVRSMALSYAKDLLVSNDKYGGRALYEIADSFYEYIKTGEHPDD